MPTIKKQPKNRWGFQSLWNGISCLYKWLLDVLVIWATPTLSGFAALAAAFLTYDFTEQYKHYPEWKHQFDLIHSILPGTLLIVQTVVFILSIFQALRQNSISKLEKKLKEAAAKVDVIANNIETLVDGLLLRLAEKLRFGKGEASRITIYIHNNDGHFISFGRYTPDPSYKGKGRNLLPDNEGCIASAWKSDWCFEGDLGSTDRDYQKICKEAYGVSRETLACIRMHSRFYAVKRIDTPDRKVPLAVVVVESKTENRFREDEIKDTLFAEESYLAEIISCLKNHIPNPQDASARGF